MNEVDIGNSSNNNDEFQKKIRACIGQQKKLHSKILLAEATCYKSYNDEKDNGEATV